MQECDSERKPRHSAYRLSITSYVRCPSSPPLQASVGREAVPATTGSADEPSKPGGEPAAQRFMLHLLAENLDYVLEALGPVS